MDGTTSIDQKRDVKCCVEAQVHENKQRYWLSQSNAILLMLSGMGAGMNNDYRFYLQPSTGNGLRRKTGNHYMVG